MTDYEHRRKETHWRKVLVALGISLLLHQTLLVILHLSGLFENALEDTVTEITLLETPEEKLPEPPAPEPEIAPPAPPPPVPQKAPPPTKAPTPKPQPPTPQAPVATAAEPEPEPQGPPDPEPPATTPTPKTAVAPRINARMNWGVFERTFGPAAEEERLQYQDELLKKRGGGVAFGTLTPKVAKAMKNNRSWVQNAPREPIDPQAPVFRNYLDATHERIHQFFADSFLPSLVSLGANHPLNNFNMYTLLEFEILESGTINEIRMLKTSGQSVFDAGAIDSLYRASPFLPPPKAILSYNNRVYFRWGFYRNQRKCGTFNATGYILRSPDAAPEAIPQKQYELPNMSPSHLQQIDS